MMYLRITYETIEIDPKSYNLIGYTNSNYANDPKDKKLVIEYYFFINGAVAFWYSKKQRTVSTSTTEAKYIASDHVAKESV